MTSLIPREPYTQDELARLYPKELKLQLVQVVRELPVDFQGTLARANHHSSFAMVRNISQYNNSAHRASLIEPRRTHPRVLKIHKCMLLLMPAPNSDLRRSPLTFPKDRPDTMYANSPRPISAETILISHRLAVLRRCKTHGTDGLEQ
jgi:hypothetical protein